MRVDSFRDSDGRGPFLAQLARDAGGARWEVHERQRGSEDLSESWTAFGSTGLPSKFGLNTGLTLAPSCITRMMSNENTTTLGLV